MMSVWDKILLRKQNSKQNFDCKAIRRYNDRILKFCLWEFCHCCLQVPKIWHPYYASIQWWPWHFRSMIPEAGTDGKVPEKSPDSTGKDGGNCWKMEAVFLPSGNFRIFSGDFRPIPVLSVRKRLEVIGKNSKISEREHCFHEIAETRCFLAGFSDLGCINRLIEWIERVYLILCHEHGK